MSEWLDSSVEELWRSSSPVDPSMHSASSKPGHHAHDLDEWKRTSFPAVLAVDDDMSITPLSSMYTPVPSTAGCWSRYGDDGSNLASLPLLRQSEVEVPAPATLVIVSAERASP
jgi:hypothetical protein